MITYPLGIQNLINEGRFSIRHMLRVDLASGAVGLWDGAYSLLSGGVTYGPLPLNMTVSEIRASSDLDVDRVRVTISGLQSGARSLIDNEVWHQRPSTLFVAFLNDAREVQHVQAVFAGFLDTAPLTDAAGDLSTLTLTIESNARELSRSNGDIRADASQRRRGANDGFFKHTANANADSQIYWGRKGPQYPSKAVIRRR